MGRYSLYEHEFSLRSGHGFLLKVYPPSSSSLTKYFYLNCSAVNPIALDNLSMSSWSSRGCSFLQQFAQVLQSIFEDTCRYNLCTIESIFSGERSQHFRKVRNFQFSSSLFFAMVSILLRLVSMRTFSNRRVGFQYPPTAIRITNLSNTVFILRRFGSSAEFQVAEEKNHS